MNFFLSCFKNYFLICQQKKKASDILNKYKKYNIYTKRDTYNLKYVELNPESIDLKITEKNSQPKSILSLIVETGNLELIVHPVIARLGNVFSSNIESIFFLLNK